MHSSCSNCGLKFSDPTLTPAACPNCGEPTVADQPVRRPFNPVKVYFKNVWQILTQPSVFFRSLPLRGGVAGPLAFALITHWMGSAVAFLWRLSVGGALGGYFEQMLRMAGDVAEVDNPGRNTQLLQITERIKHWVWGAGAVIVDPFTTLLQILFISFLVFVGARLLVTPGKNGAPREITFESALRIVCFGLTPSILAVLPLFGGPVAYIYRIIVTVIGAREAYRISGTRATLVALFPQVLLLSGILLALFAVTVAFIKFFAMTF
jgi:hypothetical protein